MYERILIPLDGSRRAEAVLPHVEALARRFDSVLLLLHVVDIPSFVVGIMGAADMALHQQELQQREGEGRAYLAGVRGTFKEKGVKARLLMRMGPVVEAIIETARSEEADLIALTSHGRSGLSRVFYGGVAAGVLNKVDRPILLVRSRSFSAE